MANIIGRMGQARESAYFKLEQEADVQRHSRRLLREGRLQDTAGKRLGGQVGHVLTDSSANFEVLSEILQQRARLHDPNAAARKDFVRRIKGLPSKVSAADMAAYRSSKLGVAALVGHVPRLALGGRNRYGLAAAAAESALAAQPQSMSPEAAEVARRSYNAGVRALTYGSILGFLGVAVGSTLVVRAMDVHSVEEFRDAVRSGAEPAAEFLRQRAEMLRSRLKGFFGLESIADSGGSSGGEVPRQMQQRSLSDGELQQRLASRWNPRAAAADSNLSQ